MSSAQKPNIKAGLRTAMGSPALRSAAILATGGVGFAIGNLLLARILSESEFGTVALLLSVIQVGATLGTLGLPTLVNRHHLDPTAALLGYSLVGSVAVSFATVAFAMRFYGMPGTVAVVLAVTVGLSAVGRVAGAFFQSRQQFGVSLFLTQIQNWLLLASVPVVLLLERPSALTVAVVMLCSYLLTTVAGWLLASRSPRGMAQPLSRRALLTEGLSAGAAVLATNLLFQLDRMVIGRVLSLNDLATYAVVMAIAGSAFRMLQVGSGYSLAPRLRAAGQRSKAMKILRREALLVFGMGALAAIAVVLVMPWVTDHFLAGRYDVPAGMIAAVIVVGFVRIFEAFAAATVSAIGTAHQLFLLSVWSWIAVGVAALCAVWGSRFGLVGVVYGLGAGWGTLALSASMLSSRALKNMPP